MSEHTKTPWHYYSGPEIGAGPICQIFDGELVKGDNYWHVPHGTNSIAVVQNVGHFPTTAANAAFIVKACNSHSQLVCALHRAMAVISQHYSGSTCCAKDIETIKAALALAKEGE